MEDRNLWFMFFPALPFFIISSLPVFVIVSVFRFVCTHFFVPLVRGVIIRDQRGFGVGGFCFCAWLVDLVNLVNGLFSLSLPIVMS